MSQLPQHLRTTSEGAESTEQDIASEPETQIDEMVSETLEEVQVHVTTLLCLHHRLTFLM